MSVKIISPETVAKIEEIRKLADIPCREGEQFLYVYLDLSSMTHGYVKFGLHWKSEMGEQNFNSLDEALNIVADLRKRMKTREDL